MVSRNTDVGFTFGGDGGGLGALPIAIRSNDSLPAVFTSVAARDTYYTTTAPADIAAGTRLANRQEAVAIGPTDGDPSAGITAAYIRNEANDDWVAIATNFIGLKGDQGDPGDPGPPGTDGVRRSFPSEAARDAFYATQPNRDDLNTDDVISVNMGSNQVEFQRWVGANAPTAYDSNNFITTSISTANASISFGQELRIFDFGEFAGYINEVQNTRSLSIAQPYTDAGGSQTARQLNFPGEATLFTTTGTTNSANQQVHEYTFNTTGVITNTAILLQGTINFVIAPQFYILEAWQGTDDTGTRVFRQRFEPGGTAGTYIARPEAPQRFEPNTTYFIRLTGDAAFQYVVGDNPGDVAPVGSGTGFEVTFDDLATEAYVMNTLAGFGEPVAITSNVTITTGNLATYDRKLIYTADAVTNNLTITISPGLSLSGFAVFPFGSGNITVEATNPATIQNTTSYTVSQYEGIRVLSEPGDNNNYGVIYTNDRVSTEEVQDAIGAMVTDNTETGITVTYDDVTGKLNFSVTATGTTITVQDEGVALSGDANTLNFTGAGVTASGTGATKNIVIPGSTVSTVLTNSFTYSATGTQNVGVDLVGGVHVLASTVTGFDLLVGTTLTADGLFAVTVQSSSAVEFDISAAAYVFAGDGSGNAYNMPANSTTLFWVSGSSTIYPLASTAQGGAAGSSDHPVAVTRDTPSLADLAALAAASTDGNSALWVVASNQITASESSVDPSIQIRALAAGIPDASGDPISTTAVAKSGVLLGAGTIVRIFSSTDLRVVSGPGTRSTIEMYPDVPFSGALRLEEGDEGLYNSYVRRTATNAGGSNQYIALPSLHSVDRPSWVVPGDVFVMRHTGSTTGSQRPHFRPDNTGDNIAGHGLQYFADPGETIAVQAPARGVRTWQLFPVSQRSDGNSYYDPEILLGDWYRDDTDATAVNNYVRLHRRLDNAVVEVPDHIRTTSATNNPISVRFYNNTPVDDFAWYSWWNTVASPPALGGPDPQDIIDSLPAALTWIQTNITAGFDFTVRPADGTAAIQSIDFVSGNTVRIVLEANIPSMVSVNHEIEIQNATNAVHNGTWAVTAIIDATTFHITNPGVSDGTVDESDSPGFIDVPLYADVVFIDNDLRQFNFNLYEDAARTSLIAPADINSEWFDHTDTGSGNLVLGIAVDPGLSINDGNLAVQNAAEEWFSAARDPDRALAFVYNGDPENSGPNEPDYLLHRNLPLEHPVIHIQTQGVANFYLPMKSSDIPLNRSRLYRIYSDANNGNNDVTLNIGVQGDTEAFDNGQTNFSLFTGRFIDLEGYNEDGRHGWRIARSFHINRVTGLPGAPVAATDSVNAPINVGSFLSITDEDPSNSFAGITGSNQIELKGALKYELEYRIHVQFNGATPSGVLVSDVQLMPVLTRNAVNTDQVHFRTGSRTLLYVNGAKTELVSRFTFLAEAGDFMQWQLRFSAFAGGFSLSDFQMLDWQTSVKVIGA